MKPAIERLKVMEDKIAELKKRRIRRADLLLLIEAIVLHLKIETGKGKKR